MVWSRGASDRQKHSRLLRPVFLFDTSELFESKLEELESADSDVLEDDEYRLENLDRSALFNSPSFRGRILPVFFHVHSEPPSGVQQ